MAKTIFERTEKKYRLSAAQYDTVLAGLLGHMRVDSYGMTTICSVYYDDNCDRIVRNSIQRPVYKEKLRLRSYGIPSADSTVYIELKKKYGGVVYKRRVGMRLSEATAYLNDGRVPEQHSQILSEIEWVRGFYKPLPKAYIAYDRLALESTEDPPLRVTFDQNIRARADRLDLSAGDGGEQLLFPGERIMEIKAIGAMPLWLCDLLCANGVYPTSFSKYGVFYQRLIEKRKSNV